MHKSHRFLVVLFGPIGDALMALALFDDILILEPDATMLIITRRGRGVIADFARNYKNVEVRQIPGGFAALPFFASLLARRWTLLTLGVAGAYSLRLKLFFLALTALGNHTVGFNDRQPGVKRWLPLNVALQFNGGVLVIDNFRRLLPYVYGAGVSSKLEGRAPTVALDASVPKDFSYSKGQYIVAHLFGTSIRRSLPHQRWISLLKQIAEAYPAYPILLTATEPDRIAAEDIAAQVRGARALINLPILEVAGVIDNAALYIGVDTGITHLAGVLQQKSIIISHFGDPAWIPTYNPNVRALANSKNCVCNTTGNCFVTEDGIPYRRCMYDISDKAILDSVTLALSSSERGVAGFAGFKDENS